MSKASLGAVLLLAAVPSAAGTVRGRVQVLDKDGKKASDTAAAAVWIDGPKVRPKPSSATVVMKGKAFSPRVVVVPVGGTVEFPNQDPILHNVFSVSGENHFDLDLYKRPRTAAHVFSHPGLVRIYCNIHPQMSAYVLVRDNPFWARPAADGSFEIPDVPPGTWRVKAWHERSGETSQVVVVPDTGTVAVTLGLDASGFKHAPHKNKFGKEYQLDDSY